MKPQDLEKLILVNRLLKGNAAILLRGRKGVTSRGMLRNLLMSEFRTKTDGAEIHRLLSQDHKEMKYETEDA